MPAPLLSHSKEAKALVSLARMRLGMSQEQFGHALGASKRTATRWDGGRASPSIPQVRILTGLVYPRDPELAAQLASATGDTLEGLGIVAPSPPPAPPPTPAPPPAPPPPPPPPPLPTALVVQAVVCAAADALQASPGTVRAPLLAAFRMARELRLSVEDVETALSATAATAPIP